jgi:exoribonuclease R
VLDNPEYKVVDLTNVDNIVSVDPEGCEDIDDAFSIRQIHDSEHDLIQVSIYIANVPLWLSVLDLWKFVESTGRITTVYLPDRKVPMLPTVLSEDLCSLKAGKLRYAFVMHATFKVQRTDSPQDLKGSLELLTITYENALIRVKTNYAYEDKQLLKSADYSLLKQVAQMLDKDSHDSHEVVATFMKFMNAQCAETLASMNTGIFRNQAGTGGPLSNSTESGSHFGETSKGSDSCKATLEMLSATGTGGPHRTSNSTESGSHFSSGEMLSARYSTINEGHAHLGLAHYTHITSPIRRLVDLINMRILMRHSQNAHQKEYSKEHLESSTIEKINKVSKSAKKAQMDCELYSKVLGADPETVYTGAIVDIDTDEFGKDTQTVYLEELKTYARVKGPLNSFYKMGFFKVYLFDDEHSLRRKIRVERV